MQWVSGSRAPQAVQWGAAPGALGARTPSRAVTYTAADMCGAPANSTGWLAPGWLHSAALPLTPSSGGGALYYRYGSEDVGWSSTHATAAPPPPGGPTRFLTFADVGMTSPVLFRNVCPPWCPPGYNFAPRCVHVCVVA